MYQAIRKKLNVQLLTRVGWLTGTLHMPERARLGDFLTAAPAFLTLTDVRSPLKREPIPFFSLSNSALRVVTLPPAEIPTTPERDVSPTKRHRVFVVLDTGTITGEIEALANTRVSDFFAHRRGFVPIFKAKLEIGPIAGAPAVSQNCDCVLVSADHLVGVGELDAKAG